jgi:hypothetical protein
MLTKSRHPSTRDVDLQCYLHETLGVIAKISEWDGDRKTPYYLRDAFELRELTLLDQRILLAIDRRKKAPPAASVREQMNMLGRIADIPVAYLTRALASYGRKRLIEQKVHKSCWSLLSTNQRYDVLGVFGACRNWLGMRPTRLCERSRSGHECAP